MSELTGRLDDMSTEGQPVCVCTRFIFPLVTADTHKSPAHDGVAAAESQQFVFFILLPREALKSLLWP